jgi:peptidoglycan hydrolase-like protein with peptidoglycan-binding domain
MAIVVDQAWNKLTASTLLGLGVVASSLYVGQDNTGKNMTPGYVAATAALGIKTITNFEYGAAQAENGFNQGVTDAKLGLAQATACGMPSWAPILFSVDVNASLASVIPYFQGAVSVLGVARVGVYGSFAIVQGLINAGLARFGWQTVAWSNGQIDLGQIQIYQNGSTVDGVDVDIIEASIDAIAWVPGEANPNTPPALTEVSFTMQVPTISATAPGPSAFYVEVAQAALNVHTLGGGAAVLTVDGSFGPATTSRVEQFQVNKGLTADGVIGPLTWAKLMA